MISYVSYLRPLCFPKQITGALPKMIFVAVDMKEEGKKSCQELNVQLITYENIKN